MVGNLNVLNSGELLKSLRDPGRQRLRFMAFRRFFCALGLKLLEWSDRG